MDTDTQEELPYEVRLKLYLRFYDNQILEYAELLKEGHEKLRLANLAGRPQNIMHLMWTFLRVNGGKLRFARRSRDKAISMIKLGLVRV
jgi:hypothetical protein